MFELDDRSRYDVAYADGTITQEACRNEQTDRSGSLPRTRSATDSRIHDFRRRPLPASSGRHDPELGLRLSLSDANRWAKTHASADRRRIRRRARLLVSQSDRAACSRRVQTRTQAPNAQNSEGDRVPQTGTQLAAPA